MTPYQHQLIVLQRTHRYQRVEHNKSLHPPIQSPDSQSAMIQPSSVSIYTLQGMSSSLQPPLSPPQNNSTLPPCQSVSRSP